MKAIILPLDRAPPTLLLLLVIVSIQLGSALAITLFPIYGPVGILLLAATIDLRASIAILLITVASVGVSLTAQADPIA